jgi:hypothetical protein
MHRGWPIAEEKVSAVLCVIPAEAGIQYSPTFLDFRLRGSDERIGLFSALPVYAVTSTLFYTHRCRLLPP